MFIRFSFAVLFLATVLFGRGLGFWPFQHVHGAAGQETQAYEDGTKRVAIIGM